MFPPPREYVRGATAVKLGTSLPFDPPPVRASGDAAAAVRLGYDLAKAVVSGTPHPASPHCSFSIAGHEDPGGGPHCFRACVDLAPDRKACMDFPELASSATQL
jgi:hypothetical protein